MKLKHWTRIFRPRIHGYKDGQKTKALLSTKHHLSAPHFQNKARLLLENQVLDQILDYVMEKLR